jgi:hypothetical protein
VLQCKPLMYTCSTPESMLLDGYCWLCQLCHMCVLYNPAAGAAATAVASVQLHSSL